MRTITFPLWMPWLAEMPTAVAKTLWIWVWAGGVFFVIGSVAKVYMAVKTAIRTAMPDGLQFAVTTAGQFPALDANALQEYTQVLESLGFRNETDYTVTAKTGKTFPGFARLFIHPHDHCYAEINQLFPPKPRLVPMRFMILSELGEDMALSSTDRIPDGITYMLRDARSFWTSHPQAAPAEVFRAHLERRRQIALKRGLREPTETSVETYFTRNAERTNRRKQRVDRMNIALGLLEAAFFSIKPKYEWMGEN
ncbi:MAG: hypothetical protein HY360_19440 [Verrucomicrobia bacterium]|nr:hypothetical protein [Verrucomicrobiota bacterium]